VGVCQEFLPVAEFARIQIASATRTLASSASADYSHSPDAQARDASDWRSFCESATWARSPDDLNLLLRLLSQDVRLGAAEEAREAHDLRADVLKHNKILGEARNMAMAGKKEEAAQALQDYIATNPGDDNVAQAKGVLQELDTLAPEGEPVREARGARGNSPKNPGKPRTRPRAKP
jgi:hypothetical protein